MKGALAWRGLPNAKVLAGTWVDARPFRAQLRYLMASGSLSVDDVAAVAGISPRLADRLLHGRERPAVAAHQSGYRAPADPDFRSTSAGTAADHGACCSGQIAATAPALRGLGRSSDCRAGTRRRSRAG